MGSLIKETPYSEITATLEVFDRYHITREHFARLRSDHDYAKRIAESMFAGDASKNSFPVTVNYGLTVEKLVNAGKYDWLNSDINAKNFPSDRKDTAEVAIELVHFGRSMESDEVLEELDKQGLRPATLAELLAFGAKYPEKQREFPIVALGSVWRYRSGARSVACLCSDTDDGSRDVAYLCGGTDGRYLNLNWLESRWTAHYRFAAVRK
jgi:hypothetical protein